MDSQIEQFVVQHEAFVGPIEVLLELIEKRKLFVNDISLATVTDDFINYIKTNGVQENMVAQFLSVAATLILIKARSLLPTIDLTRDEEESISDLEKRLALYKLISSASSDIIKQYGKHISFGGFYRVSGVVFAPDEKLQKEDFLNLATELINKVPKKVEHKNPEVKVKVSISITEVLERLEERISRLLEGGNFKDICINSPDGEDQKVYTIISFLGMLEMVRNGLIMAEQSDGDDDIKISKPALVQVDNTKFF